MPPVKSKNQVSKWERALEKYFLWLALGLSILIIILGVWFLWRPVYNEWQGGVDLNKERNELQVARARFEVLKKLFTDWENLKVKPAGRDLPLILPSEAEVPNLLVQLEAIARDTGFKLQGIAVSEASGKGTSRKGESGATTISGARPIKITLSLDGATYPKVKTLLKALDQAWRLIQVDSFTVGRDSALSLELTAYYFP